MLRIPLEIVSQQCSTNICFFRLQTNMCKPIYRGDTGYIQKRLSLLGLIGRSKDDLFYFTEQPPPHNPLVPPPSLQDNRTPLFVSLSHIPGVWIIFPTSSSNTYCTSLVFALASERKQDRA
ncbi:hypothetical protein XELAEV_18003534mg [Xenopus laevis]|uniref:Uncharacterized protein n=1 Tax=Xenopus laevis TaxID=8355 RepID=A0A974GY52_XENLA|nr:hypothetical protein XELAEV_18003534mg [Xenopus laevis]